MIKVLLIQEVISNYRVPVYNLIAENFDFTLLYSDGNVPDGVQFPIIKHEALKKGPFKFFKQGFSKIIKQYDVVIFLFNPMEASIVWEILKNKVTRHRKFIPWGIGVPASYNVKYDDPSKKLSHFLTRKIINLSDAVVFYSDYPANKYAKLGVDKQKMFVAHNTVSIYPIDEGAANQIEKNCFLFVGSLYKQKGVGVLLDAYECALASNPNLIPLFIVGGGAEYNDLNNYIKEKHLDHKVVLTGPIYDEKVLSSYFLKARACISPNQAGLSVQKSLGYGVPFVTKEDAITGGERFDIINNETGIMYSNDSQLSDILLDINNNCSKFERMGKKGRIFYANNRTVKQMAQGVIDAINYALTTGNN